MPLSILLMILAFLMGIAFDYVKTNCKHVQVRPKDPNRTRRYKKIRKSFYKLVVVYLLIKIGFVGGSQIFGDGVEDLALSGFMVVFFASLWTLIVLALLNRWSSLTKLNRISIAAHFGSVSVGTFIAAVAFLEAHGVEVDPRAAIWLALMELPGTLIGIYKLGVRSSSIVPILKSEKILAVLPIAIILGMIFGNNLNATFSEFFFGTLFMPMIIYFLFEMGRNAGESLFKFKGKIASLIFLGISLPILGGFWGISIGQLLGYDAGSTFIFAILMASASYVLAPLCMEEVLKSMYKPNPEIAKQVIATSMALSVGITLPFNIIVGLELYYSVINVLHSFHFVAVIGALLPFLLLLVSRFTAVRSN